MRWLLVGLLVSLASALPLDVAYNATEVPGVNPPPQCGEGTELTGNGSPTQVYFHLQRTEPSDCTGGHGCSVSSSNLHTYGYSVSASIAQWITGGFSVSESWSEGETHTCDGSAGQTVCVFQKVAYTAYTVHNVYGNGVTCPRTNGPNRVIKSPHTGNNGGGYYCVYGSGCHGVGYSFWS